MIANPRAPVSRSITYVCSSLAVAITCWERRASRERWWRLPIARKRTPKTSASPIATAMAAKAIRVTRPESAHHLLGRPFRSARACCSFCVGAGLAHRRLGENLLHRSRDLLGLERFYHDEVGALPQGLLTGPGLRGQDDDRSVREGLVLPQLGQHFEPAQTRHHHVENHHVRPKATGQLERLLAVVGLCKLGTGRPG